MSTDDAHYFRYRQVCANAYEHYLLPFYLARRLPENKDACILDFGCGFGQFVRALAQRGYEKAVGYDIEPSAIAFCRDQGVPVIDGMHMPLDELPDQYDFIYSSHVIEHIPKDAVIDILRSLRQRLKAGGTLLVCVPNAQSNTGCYWAYEDFTHYTAYTSGSLYYVLSKAGFHTIAFVDTDCTEGMSVMRRTIKRALLSIYRAKYRFWNRVTNSATHVPSPDIFSYEIKATARG